MVLTRGLLLCREVSRGADKGLYLRVERFEGTYGTTDHIYTSYTTNCAGAFAHEAHTWHTQAHDVFFVLALDRYVTPFYRRTEYSTLLT